MTVHMVKLCVGAASMEDLAEWQTAHRQFWKKHNGKPCVFHTTFQSPKRVDDLTNGGSLYWVIKGLIQARQALVGFDEGHKEDGSKCCLLLLAPEIIPVRPVPRRAFQGWRYLSADDAPEDLTAGQSDGVTSMPMKLRKDLAALGLI